MWFDNWSDMWRVLVISVTIYAALIAMLRLVGKRALAKLNIFDLVITVALGSTLATIVLSTSVSFAEGVLAFACLCFLQWLVAWLSIRSKTFKRIIRSDARILLQDGRFLWENMEAERITRGEIEAAIRKKGNGKIEETTAVVLETDGDMSVIVNGAAENCSALKPLTRGSEDTEDT